MSPALRTRGLRDFRRWLVNLIDKHALGKEARNVRSGSTCLAIVVCALLVACRGEHSGSPMPATSDGAPGVDAAGGADATAPADGPPVIADARSGADAVETRPITQAGDARDAPSAEAADAPADGADAAPALPARVLLYHFSTLVIDTVPQQLTFFEQLLASWGYASDDSVDPGKFTDDGLAAYGAVAMINTCFFPFGAGKDGAPESAALQRFVARGGGLFGTHCAAVTFQSVSPPPLYNQL